MSSEPTINPRFQFLRTYGSRAAADVARSVMQERLILPSEKYPVFRVNLHNDGKRDFWMLYVDPGPSGRSVREYEFIAMGLSWGWETRHLLNCALADADKAVQP